TRFSRDWSSDVCSSDLWSLLFWGFRLWGHGLGLGSRFCIFLGFGRGRFLGSLGQNVLDLQLGQILSVTIFLLKALTSLFLENDQIGRASCRKRVTMWIG